MSGTCRILIVAPEASSDVAAALLAERLKARHGAEIVAAGRSALRKAGARVIADTSVLGQVGLASVLATVPRWWRVARAVLGYIRRERPDALVPFACRRFTLELVYRAKQQPPSVVWVYPPGDWVRSGPVEESVLRAADLFVCAFEWQATRYEQHGARVLRVPHHSALPIDANVYNMETLGVGPEAWPVIAVLPGSRPDEVTRLMPILAEALRLLSVTYPKLYAIVSCAPSVCQARLAAYVTGLPCRNVVSSLPVRVIAANATIAIACCGTGSTEVAVAGCPQVVVYKPAWLTAKVMQHLGKRRDIRFLSMINLGLGRRVVPELLHTECRPDRIAQEVSQLLRDPEAMAAMRASYAELVAAMNHGSWDDAADAIVALARKERR